MQLCLLCDDIAVVLIDIQNSDISKCTPVSSSDGIGDNFTADFSCLLRQSFRALIEVDCASISCPRLISPMFAECSFCRVYDCLAAPIVEPETHRLHVMELGQLFQQFGLRSRKSIDRLIRITDC
jgi:hypothetical protein